MSKLFRISSFDRVAGGWAGERSPGLKRPFQMYSRKVVFLGAGFTRSIDGRAPLFSELAEWAALALRAAGDPMAKSMPDTVRHSPAQVFERFEQNLSRTRLAETVLKWPPPSHPLARFIGTHSLPWIWQNPSSPLRRTYFPWMLFRDFVDHLACSYPQQIPSAGPDSPPVMLARLLREGICKTIVTTNWDAHVEIGCHMVGLVVNSHGDHGAVHGLAAGDVVSVRSPLDLYHEGQEVDSIELLKVNGCLQHVAEAFAVDDEGVREKILSQALAITVMDLDSWDGPTWVQPAVEETLRGARVLFVGVSGDDQVTYRIVRKIIRERGEIRALLNQWRRGGSHPRASAGRPLFFALEHSKDESSLRLESMVHSVPPLRAGTLPIAHVRNGRLFWRLLYAWVVTNTLLQALEKAATTFPRLRRLTELLHCQWMDVYSAAKGALTDNPPSTWGSSNRGAALSLRILVGLIPRWMTLSQQGQADPRCLLAPVPIHEEWPTYYLPFLRCDGETSPLRLEERAKLLPALAALVSVLLTVAMSSPNRITVDGDDLQLIDPGRSTVLARLLQKLCQKRCDGQQPAPPILLRCVLSPVDPAHRFTWRGAPSQIRFNRCYGKRLLLHIRREPILRLAPNVSHRYWNGHFFTVCETTTVRFLERAITELGL